MTAEPLALKYRPRTFPELVGQKPVQVVLLGMLHDPNPSREPLFTPKAEPDIPPVMLFAGTHGSGKTSTARIVAAALNCEGQGDLGLRPCGKCQSCDEAFAGASVDILEIDAASNGTVAEVRALKEQVSYQNGSRYKVVLLDEAHSMSKEAFNATLKLLEEPPERTVFILLTTEPGKDSGDRGQPVRAVQLPPHRARVHPAEAGEGVRVRGAGDRAGAAGLAGRAG